MDELTSFCAAVADVLEVESIGPADAFRDAPGWCSLKAFGLLVTLENDWRTPLTVGRLQELKTVGDLWREVGATRCAPASGAPAREGTRRTATREGTRRTATREGTRRTEI